jgi:hypothetical protein
VALTASLTANELDVGPPANEWALDASDDPSIGQQLIERDDFQSLEGQATTLLERSIRGNVWVGTTAVWNASCAALLADAMPESLQASLEAPWQRALGKTPRELISALRRT